MGGRALERRSSPKLGIWSLSISLKTSLQAPDPGRRPGAATATASPWLSAPFHSRHTFASHPEPPSDRGKAGRAKVRSGARGDLPGARSPAEPWGRLQRTVAAPLCPGPCPGPGVAAGVFGPWGRPGPRCGQASDPATPPRQAGLRSFPLSSADRSGSSLVGWGSREGRPRDPKTLSDGGRAWRKRQRVRGGSLKCPGQRDSRGQGGDEKSHPEEAGREPRPRTSSNLPLNTPKAQGRKRLAARPPVHWAFQALVPGGDRGQWPGPHFPRQPQLAACPSDPPSSLKVGLTAATSQGPRRAHPAAFLPDRTPPPSLRMPEGPELRLASQFVNEACRALVFGGCVEKSSVSRNPKVPFESSAYHISASARRKELRLTLSPLPGAQPPRSRWPWSSASACPAPSSRFPAGSCHATPTCAFTRLCPAPSLPYVSWTSSGSATGILGASGSRAMGPANKFSEPLSPSSYAPRLCPSRENVLRNLLDKAFDWPLCEALLDQRFFNGIGNYLRVEILYRSASRHGHGDRLKIPPFEKAWSLLEALQQPRPSPELTLSQKIKAKLQNPDLLELCHSVPKEVVQLGGKGYRSESREEDFAPFCTWLPCYGMPGMSSLQDRNGRTICFQVGPCSHRQRDPMRLMGGNETWGHKNWGGDARGLSRPSEDHTGDPGPLTPKGGKSCKKKSKATQPSPEDGVEVWLPAPPPPPLYSCPGCPRPTSSSPVPLPCFRPPRQLPYPKRVGGVASPNQPLQSPLGTRASSIQDCPSRSKDPSRTRRAKRDLPERTATQRPEATSFQQDPEAPKIPKKGRRKGRQAASGQRRPRKAKADTPSLELEGTSAS
ncbi:hypothetical protein P7K49_017262 [Saguinus oedipus]|uniref:Endonuclease VIII-like 1 DNA binding domain-containing protein n=1 Tax=Saguinus oedipus TaxID=9490 RepID=A0ABQ9V205_SAGOE|nr:hypothetical protein P7K49_017262 [Saguinus oedipus]